MLQVNIISSNKERVLHGLKKKNFNNTEVIDEVLELEEKRKKFKYQRDEVLSKTNQLSKEIGELFKVGKQQEAELLKEKSTLLKEESKKLGDQLNEVESLLQDKLIIIPNLPHESVPAGKEPDDNEIVREGGKMPDLPENARPHWVLMEDHGLINLELGNKITGAGFPVYQRKGAKLQRALVNFFLDKALEAGYNEVIPPYLVNEQTAFGTGQLPDKEGQMYELRQEKYFLIPTAEVPVTNIYRDEIIGEVDLPIKMVAYSPCFRREAGSYGKDVRGLNRVHQFEKVEIVQIQHPEKSYETLEEMVLYVEGLLSELELPYRIVKLCGGDMSFTSALTYDMEVYSAAQEKWLEVSSISNFEAFQANRMKMRYRGADNKTHLVHTLNGSALALPRIMAAILENNQGEDHIKVPSVLQKYTGFDVFR